MSNQHLKHLRPTMSDTSEPFVDATEAFPRQYDLSMKMFDELTKRFSYHAPYADQLPRYIALRDLAGSLARLIVKLTPPSREQALALTKLEEAVMHANSAIAREPRENG